MEQQRVRYQNVLMDSARWDDVSFRDGDIVISTPPKCGTTWTQMICALLIFQTPEFPAALDTLSLWPDMVIRRREDLLAQLAAQQHRRFFKTHTPLDGLPFDERVSYICVGRDPRDAAISWDHHFQNIDFETVMAMRRAAGGPEDPDSLSEAAMNDLPAPKEDPRDRFWAWVDNRDVLIGLGAMFHHLSGFWAAQQLPNVLLLHYGDLQTDLEGQMRRVATHLGISVPESRWPELVSAARFDFMRSRATQYAPEITIWRDPERFFYRGTNGQWSDLLDDADLRRYAARVDEVAQPDLANWAHQGSLPH